jgi:hypothetical protein
MEHSDMSLLNNVIPLFDEMSNGIRSSEKEREGLLRRVSQLDSQSNRQAVDYTRSMEENEVRLHLTITLANHFLTVVTLCLEQRLATLCTEQSSTIKTLREVKSHDLITEPLVFPHCCPTNISHPGV